MSIIIIGIDLAMLRPPIYFWLALDITRNTSYYIYLINKQQDEAYDKNSGFIESESTQDER